MAILGSAAGEFLPAANPLELGFLGRINDSPKRKVSRAPGLDLQPDLDADQAQAIEIHGTPADHFSMGLDL